MHIPDIRLHEPRTIAEACELLNRYCDISKVLAGGTDLLVDLKQGRITGIEHLVSLRNIDGLESVEETGEAIRVGALVTLNQASGNETIRKFFPAMIDTIGSMAAYTIRNVATVVGNIAGAVPSSDLAPFFVVAGGEAELSNGESQRRMKVEDYILGPRETACGEYEILTHLLIPKPPPRTGISYQKFMLREANALAVAGVAARLTLAGSIGGGGGAGGGRDVGGVGGTGGTGGDGGTGDKRGTGGDRSTRGTGDGEGGIMDSCIAMTAVAPRPVIAREACAFLEGKEPSKEVFREAAAIARESARPITDIRGTKEYRFDLIEVLTERTLEEALSRARGE
ncbi:MAG: FAD binding domain-containing protein [bacterium]|nr:MAG: FAD binding domain-containing protein [bacterium]